MLINDELSKKREDKWTLIFFCEKMYDKMERWVIKKYGIFMVLLLWNNGIIFMVMSEHIMIKKYAYFFW